MKTAAVLTGLAVLSMFGAAASAQTSSITRETLIKVATANGHAYACGDPGATEQGVRIADWLTRNYGQRQALTYAFVAGAASTTPDTANCPAHMARWKEFVATVSKPGMSNAQIVEMQGRLPEVPSNKAFSDWSAKAMEEGKMGA